MSDPSVTGDLDDRVVLRFTNSEGVSNDIPDVESYEATKAILTQPSGFSARLGWGGVVRDLISVLIPGLRFTLLINDAPQFTGFLDGFEASDDPGATELTIHGRDILARLHDAYVDSEFTLADVTYAELVQHEIDATYGVDDNTPPLFFNNDANRKTTTGIGVTPTVPTSADPTQKATGPTKKQLQAHIGDRRYEFLKRQLDRAGLFLWAGGLGELVLTAPNGNQPAAYRIVRRRGQTRNAVNVISARYKNDTSGRFSEAVVHAHGGGRKSGRSKLRGEFTDDEMVGYGIERPFVVADNNITNATQAAFYARRKLAETRRIGWALTYTVAGHTVPSLFGGARAVWTVDTVVSVDDDEFGLKDDFYVERVVFRRNPKTTTELTLIRKADLVFASGEG